MKGAAAERLRSLAAAVAGHAAGVASAAPGALHDLRVGCRRLETSLRLWGGGPGGRAAREAARELRRAARAPREAEVLLALVSRRGAGLARVPIASRRAWITELATGAAANALPDGAAERVLAGAAAAAVRIEAKGARMGRARRRVRRWQKIALAALERGLSDGGAAALHRARLALKRWRYAEESLALARGSRSRPAAERIRSWQTALGELNDLSALAGFLAGRSPAGPALVPGIEQRRLAALERLRHRHAALAKR